MTDLNSKSSTNLPTLSQDTVDQLIRLKDEDIDEFYRLVAALKANKWPHRAISTPLGYSRSIVSDWESKADKQDLPKVEELPPILPREVRPVYKGYTIEPQDAEKLYDLARQASTVRRFTDQNAPSRMAARKLESLLHYHENRGASLAQLARACGVTRRAIAQRLEKEKVQDGD